MSSEEEERLAVVREAAGKASLEALDAITEETIGAWADFGAASRAFAAVLSEAGASRLHVVSIGIGAFLEAAALLADD